MFAFDHSSVPGGSPTAAGGPGFALDAFGIKDWRAAAAGGGIAMSRIPAARPGEGGSGTDCFGRGGEDLYIPVPVGTVVRDHSRR